jgi:hypothetical protein
LKILDNSSLELRTSQLLIARNILEQDSGVQALSSQGEECPD